MREGSVGTFTANGAIGDKIRVKLTAGSTTNPPQVEVAGVGEQHIGISEYAAADTDLISIRFRTAPGTQEATASKVITQGSVLYGAAAGKVSDASSGTAIGLAIEAASGDGHVIEIIDFTVISTTAASISIADSGNIITGVTVEAALAEIMTGIKTAQYSLFPQAMTMEDGTALTIFADGASGVGWTQLASKELALRWNNQATPDDIAISFVMPQDLNDAADVILHLMGAIVKAGGAEADSPVFTVEAYFGVPGAAPGADANCGGDSGEFLTAATDTWQEKTLTIAAADVPASPSVLTLVLHPKDGQLGTDDFVLLTPWLEVTRKCLTA
jgi:hypothetical protein